MMILGNAIAASGGIPLEASQVNNSNKIWLEEDAGQTKIPAPKCIEREICAKADIDKPHKVRYVLAPHGLKRPRASSLVRIRNSR